MDEVYQPRERNREAAEECSPPRKRWEAKDKAVKAPDGAEEERASG